MSDAGGKLALAERDRLRNDLQELTCGDERYTRLGRQNERLRAALEQVHTQADQWLDNPLATGTRVIERIEKLAREALESSAPETTGRPAQVSAEVIEFLKHMANETPEKPDYWSSCGQCERNSNSADDLLESICCCDWKDGKIAYQRPGCLVHPLETAVCTHGAMSPELCRVCTPGESR
jgi:hypothetical protein